MKDKGNLRNTSFCFYDSIGIVSFRLDMLVEGIGRAKGLPALIAIEIGDSLVLYFSHFAVELLSSDWRELNHFPLDIVAMVI